MVVGNGAQEIRRREDVDLKAKPADASFQLDLGNLVRGCRLAVCEKFMLGPDYALDEIASASLRLAPFVLSGSLLPCAAWDELQAVAENLGLVRIFGQDAVQAAIAFGPAVLRREGFEC